MIRTSIENIRPGAWFVDGHDHKMMKIQDILPSGIQQCILRCTPEGRIMSDFNINAIYEDGGPACCPYEMEIFYVKSVDDLRNADEIERAPKVRHLPIEQMCCPSSKIRVGMTREQVIDAIGNPDEKGGTSKKYPVPRVFKYRDFELHFQQIGRAHV